MEGDSLSLDLTFFHIDLVASKNDGDLFADTDEVTLDDVRVTQCKEKDGISRCQLGTFL